MPKTSFDNKDLARGKRLMEERKKIWKSREDFGKETQFSGGTLQNWEGKGADIPSSALEFMRQSGMDIIYILSGKRSGEVSGSGSDSLKEDAAGTDTDAALRWLEKRYQEILVENRRLQKENNELRERLSRLQDDLSGSASA